MLRGAEAILIHKGSKVIKHRIKKGYRIDELDLKLRKERTNKEAKMMMKARRCGINTPVVYEKDLKEMKIVMEFIDGEMLSKVLSNMEKDKIKSLCKKIGEAVSKMHDNSVIHGDLTTSNMILKDGEIYFIDFGLSFHSQRIEDKAVDVYLFKNALKASHSKIWELCFNSFLEGYKLCKDYKEVIERLKKIEKRGRYTT